MISCVEWVPQGAADPNPKRYELSKAEVEMLEAQAEMEGDLQGEEAGVDHDEATGDDDDDTSVEDVAGEETRGKSKSKVKLAPVDIKALPADLRMDEYSDDEDEGRVGELLVGKENELLGTHLDKDGMPAENIEGEDEDGDGNNGNDSSSNGDSDDDDDDDDDLADVADTREFMPVDVEGLEAMGLSAAGLGATMNLGDDDDEDGDDASDQEDTNLRPDDAIMVVAKTEDDFASLEVHVYEQSNGNLYVHHDIPLPSFPLCLAHGDINCDGGAGNYCAVGTFSPGIEVWNLDVLSALEPTCILGGEDTAAADEMMKINMARAATGKKLKKKKKKIVGGGLRPGSHTDAVMALSWNKVHRQVIASGSADRTVKVWDITQAESPNACAATFNHHTDKVQSVAWHPSEGTILATGSFDRSVALVDARTNSGKNCRRAKIPADCESLAWDPFQQQYLAAASEDGTVTCWDVRKFDEKLWSFVAHDFGGVSDLSYNAHVPGMLATCAIDKTVKLWDVHSPSATPDKIPHPCGSKDMGVGKLHTISFYPSSPWLLGCGGSGNQLSLWDLSNEVPIRNRFGGRVAAESNTRTSELQDGKGSGKEEDFEAMMAAGDAAVEKAREDMKAKKRSKGKGKKKVHRKGR